MVELCQTPINQPQLSLLVVDHNVVRLDISVHNALAVAEIESLQQLKNVVPDIVVDESRIQRPEVCVVDVLEDQAGRFALAVTYHVQQCDDVGPARKVLEDFDLSLYFLLLDRFEDLDDTLLVVGDINALEHLRVFASPCVTISC